MRAIILLFSVFAVAAASLISNSATRAQAASPVGPIWELSQLTKFHTKAVTIDDPSQYAVQLLNDGRVSALADCGTVDGSWRDGDGSSNSLDIQIAVATLVACSSGQGQLFLLALDEATRYEIKGNTLTLTLAADDEKMVLTRVEAGA